MRRTRRRRGVDGDKSTLTRQQDHVIDTVLELIRKSLDTWATATANGTILYGRKRFEGQRKVLKRYLTYPQVESIYTDMYGDPAQRWEESPEYKRMMRHRRRAKSVLS